MLPVSRAGWGFSYNSVLYHVKEAVEKTGCRRYITYVILDCEVEGTAATVIALMSSYKVPAQSQPHPF